MLTIVEKITSVVEKAETFLKQMNDDNSNGQHFHRTLTIEGTSMDGVHHHNFTVPFDAQFVLEESKGGRINISAGTVLQTNKGGPHKHKVIDGEISNAMSTHRHVITINDEFELYTEMDGGHHHDSDGSHVHNLYINEKFIMSDGIQKKGAATELDNREKKVKQTPSDDMTQEELIEAREARSKEFDIEVIEGSALTFPAGKPTNLDDYADPVNLKYPIDTIERARNARVRFKQFADQYTQEKSRAVVHERIVRRELEFGVSPSFDPDDPLDALLPSDLKDALIALKKTVRLLKFDDDQMERIVFGVVLVPNEADSQGEIYDEETVRNAAYSFMESGQHTKIMHAGAPVDNVAVIESYVTKVSEPHGGETFPVGTWLLAVRVKNDDVWAAVLDGSFTGFSMGGTALREEL